MHVTLNSRNCTGEDDRLQTWLKCMGDMAEEAGQMHELLYL